jgi:hypothetical protein
MLSNVEWYRPNKDNQSLLESDQPTPIEMFVSK